MSKRGSNTLQQASGITSAMLAAASFRATVESNDSNQVYIIRDGNTERDETSYPKLSGVTVVAGDEVLVIQVATRYVVIGKILRN